MPYTILEPGTHTAKLRCTCDVLVVGAGPTGLTLAVALASRGAKVAIIDRQAEGANTSRAAVVHARTLEALEQIAVSSRLTARGLKIPTFAVRDRDRILMNVDFSHLPTRYPYTLMISQAITESILVDRLRELGGEVLRPRALAGLEQDAEGVSAVLDDGSRFRSRYVVGADGMHSKVRELAGIGFAGASYAESFLLADVRLSGVPRDQVGLYFSPAGLMVAAPLPDAVHRIVATVENAPESPGIADVQAILDERGPERDRPVVDQVIWGSRFRVHHRIADRYRVGRLILAGDAAHVHSPAGGQGMNTGIQDAIALSHALDTTLGSGNDAALDNYGATRKPVAEDVIALADRLTQAATAGRTWRPLRNLVFRLLGRSARFRNKLALRLAGLA
jgi:2-polyprenyl-6-methoxyphenol hydroxylase-like FAD-dependent oxidoreductase